ncbi:glycosyltransferase family 2 protein [Methylobacterium sp. ID0610]|uniref:glycosyltransferase family 2 protein n=1 Tax=Methylobacterium carpenticola TaxID=3344827 RepID=UPI00368E8FBB
MGESALAVAASAGNPVRVSVIVPHYDDLDRLDACLDCLTRQTLPREHFEVVVCDNASPCGVEAVRARIRGRARLIVETERGAAAARNRAVREARGDILAFTDSDCRPQPDWLRAGIGELDAADIVGGLVRVRAQDEAAMTPVEAFEAVFAFRNSKYVRRNGFSVTASLFTTRRTFGRVGGFRRGLSEDVDWCRRAVLMGYRLAYSDRVVIEHPARRTLSELEAKWFRMITESYGLTRAGGRRGLLWLMRHWLVLLSIGPHLVVVALTSKLSRWRDRLNAARILIHIRLYRFLLSHRLYFLGAVGERTDRPDRTLTESTPKRAASATIPPKAIVAVVGYNCADILARLVAACDRLDFPELEIHICENGGAAAFSALVEALAPTCDGVLGRDEAGPLPARVVGRARGRTHGGRALLVYEASGNLGYSGGLNVVADAVADDPAWTAFWVLNPDAKPEPSALAALHSHLAAGSYGAVGARLVFSASNTVQQYGGRWRWWLGRGLNVGYGRPADAAVDVGAVEREINYVSGACLLASRTFVEQVGPMDERYFLFSEEVDWCLRRGTLPLGYCHEAVIHHDHGATIGSSRDMSARSALSIYLLERSGVLLTWKFRPALMPLVAVTAGLYTLRYLRRGGWSQFRHAFAGWAAGLRRETGFPKQFARPPTSAQTLNEAASA